MFSASWGDCPDKRVILCKGKGGKEGERRKGEGFKVGEKRPCE